MNRPRKIRVAMIGLGKLGILHTSVMNMIPDAEICALVDINKQLARYAEQAGLKAPFFTETETMLDRIHPAAVVVCVPAFANLPTAEACLGRGVDMFVEKPLAHTYAAAKTMAELAARKNVVHATGYLMAHMAIYKKAKEVISSGVLGRLERVRSATYTSEVFSKKKGWLYDQEKAGGGAVISIASHLLFLLSWYFGPAREVFARTKSIYSDVEDAAAAFFVFDNGLQATMDVSWSLPGYRLPHTEIHVEGDNGTMEITGDYIKLNLFRAHAGYPKERTTIHKIDLPSEGRFIIGAEGLYEEDQDFISRCLDRGRPAVSWAEGLDVQVMIEGIYRSAAQKNVFAMGDLG